MTTDEKLEALVKRAEENGVILTKDKDHPDYYIYKVQSVQGELVIEVICTADTDFYTSEELSVNDFLYRQDVARALFGEEKKEWLGGYIWYSLYEQDSYTFKDVDELLELLDSWVYGGGIRLKPLRAELEALPSEGMKVSAGMVEKWVVLTNEGFKHHLQQAVISKDPIDYMYRAVFGDK